MIQFDSSDGLLEFFFFERECLFAEVEFLRRLDCPNFPFLKMAVICDVDLKVSFEIGGYFDRLSWSDVRFRHAEP